MIKSNYCKFGPLSILINVSEPISYPFTLAPTDQLLAKSEAKERAKKQAEMEEAINIMQRVGREKVGEHKGEVASKRN